MTFGPAQIQNVINIHNGVSSPPAKSWGFWGNKAYDYAIACHWGHKTDFAAALLCYCIFFTAGWEEACKTWSLSVSQPPGKSDDEGFPLRSGGRGGGRLYLNPPIGKKKLSVRLSVFFLG
eukprot:SAG22_NODE_88_length_21409_cov_11.207180_8_plen_120_part_00